MKWISAVSTERDFDAALTDAGAALRSQLGSTQPHLIVLFASPHHAEHYERVPEAIAAQFGSAILIGCSAGGVIGGGKEIEQRPGLSLTAAVLPDVELVPFHVDAAAVLEHDESFAWENHIAVPAATRPHFLLLADPFTFDAETFLRALDHTYPGSQKIGGLASGATQPGANALFLGADVHRSGLVGVALSGNVEVDTVVAQGCRPVGQPMFITKCHENILWELDGEPAVKVLQELFARLDPADQELARVSLFLGIVMSENQQEYRQGDFLIRNIVGMDTSRGVLAIGAHLHENSVVQFHLRDAQTSGQDVEQLLSRYAAVERSAQPRGALLFSCLGRGVYLYGEADYDTKVFRRYLGDVPLGGFFCNGEIGPVHGTTFVHGYTSSFGLFRSRDV